MSCVWEVCLSFQGKNPVNSGFFVVKIYGDVLKETSWTGQRGSLLHVVGDVAAD